MNSFDAVSGTIDALVAIGIYALLIFGVRSIVHKVRKTDPKKANTKWLWLSTLSVAALVFVAGGSMSGESTSITPIDPRSDRCTQVTTAFKNLAGQMPGAGATTYQDTQIKRNTMRQISYLIVGSPDCFPPGDVAYAQNFLDQTR